FAAQVDVEAVLQETLLRVWQVAPRVTPDGSANALLRFAIRAGRNLAISTLRRRDPLAVAVAHRDEAFATPSEPDPLLREALRRCLDALRGPAARAMAQRLDDEGARSDHALAEAAGMRLNTFLQNVRRARIAVQRC